MPSRFSPQKRSSSSSSKRPSQVRAAQKQVAEKKETKPVKEKKVTKKPVIEKTSPQDHMVHLHNMYKKSKSRNIFRAFLYGILSLFVLGLVLITLIPLLWSVDINLSGIVTTFLPESISGPALPKERINMIALGIGGYENDAPDLTDSIMFISYDNSRPAGETEATMVSIPRDLYVYSDILGYTRINAIYSGVKRRFGHDAAVAHLMEKVAEITGKPVDYYAIVDFRGFRDFVDRIGGITVDVPERLYDDSYPNSTWGYTTFLVEKGIQEFDGDKALKYVRSRHTTSDFDRSRRQQIVLRAVKSKLIEEGYLRNPKKIENLFLTMQDNFQTNLTIGQIIQFSALMYDFDSEYQLYSFNLNDECYNAITNCSTGGLLYAPNRDLVNGQAVLLPNGATPSNVSNYTEIQRFIHLVVSYPKYNQLSREIHIFNATRTPGIAYEFGMMLKSFGFNVPNDQVLGNVDLDDTADSFLYYDASLPADDPTLQALDLMFYGDQIPHEMPVYGEVGESAIEIILGDDSDIFFR